MTNTNNLQGDAMANTPEKKSIVTKAKVIDTKAEGDVGTFKAVVSVFNNIDLVGDVIMPGAFTKTLAEWDESGDNIPFIWNHDLDDPYSHIGEITSAIQTKEGLEVSGTLDLENPKAKQVHKLMKGRRVKEYSFGFFIRDAKASERDGMPVRELLDLDVFEISTTLVGANPATRTLDVKSSPEEKELAVDETTDQNEVETPADDPTSKAVAVITTAIESLQNLLSELESTDESTEAESEPQVETEEASKSAEVVEPVQHATASVSEADEEPFEVKSAINETAIAKAQALKDYLNTI